MADLDSFELHCLIIVVFPVEAFVYGKVVESAGSSDVCVGVGSDDCSVDAAVDF